MEKMNMKKKLLALGLAAVMAGMTACGTTSDSSKGDSSGDKDNTLTVWAWDSQFNLYAMEEAARIYQKDHPDFNLETVEITWDDLQTKLGTIIGSGDYSQLPDICLMQDYAYQKYVTIYDGLFQDITDCGIDFTQFAEGKLSASVVDGKNYGVPFDNGTDVAIYRTDILADAGYSIEDLTGIDWNRFIEIGKDVYSKTGYSLLSIQTGSSDIIYQMMQSAGQSTWNEDGTPNIAGNKVLKQCLEIYKEMADTHVMDVRNSWDEYVATFTSGKTAGVINGCWIMVQLQSAEELSGLWNVTNVPSLPGVEGATNYTNQGGSTWAVTSNCSNVELATDFLGSTFAGSMELYDTILPGAGAISTWLPAGESDVYAEPQEFYGEQAVYKQIADYAAEVPSVDLGVYYTEANTALATVIGNILGGADIDSELETAQSTVEFNMR
ncbi:MAG: extracellular solute-binding protein [Lachnospiraceae bacterium]|nr:extracellular solute-binding protein [Lachnospiraceae bacterium]